MTSSKPVSTFDLREGNLAEVPGMCLPPARTARTGSSKVLRFPTIDTSLPSLREKRYSPTKIRSVPSNFGPNTETATQSLLFGANE